MYNGIGLPTPRGSGTNGYVQRNWAFVRKTKDKSNYKTEEDIEKLEASNNKQPNKEILDHERKRKVEVKCMELEEILEDQGYSPSEIESKVASYRALLVDGGSKATAPPRDEFGRIIVRETHQIAEAQQEKNAKLREAFGISEYFVEGSSLDPQRHVKEAQAKAAAEQNKKYTLVHTPTPSPQHSDSEQTEKAKKKKKRPRERSSSPEGRKEKKKKSKKHKRDRSESPSKHSKKKTSSKDKKKEQRKRPSHSSCVTSSPVPTDDSDSENDLSEEETKHRKKKEKSKHEKKTEKSEKHSTSEKKSGKDTGKKQTLVADSSDSEEEQVRHPSNHSRRRDSSSSPVKSSTRLERSKNNRTLPKERSTSRENNHKKSIRKPRSPSVEHNYRKNFKDVNQKNRTEKRDGNSNITDTRGAFKTRHTDKSRSVSRSSSYDKHRKRSSPRLHSHDKRENKRRSGSRDVKKGERRSGSRDVKKGERRSGSRDVRKGDNKTTYSSKNDCYDRREQRKNSYTDEPKIQNTYKSHSENKLRHSGSRERIYRKTLPHRDEIPTRSRSRNRSISKEKIPSSQTRRRRSSSASEERRHNSNREHNRKQRSTSTHNNRQKDIERGLHSHRNRSTTKDGSHKKGSTSRENSPHRCSTTRDQSYHRVSTSRDRNRKRRSTSRDHRRPRRSSSKDLSHQRCTTSREHTPGKHSRSVSTRNHNSKNSKHIEKDSKHHSDRDVDKSNLYENSSHTKKIRKSRSLSQEQDSEAADKSRRYEERSSKNRVESQIHTVSAESRKKRRDDSTDDICFEKSKYKGLRKPRDRARSNSSSDERNFASREKVADSGKRNEKAQNLKDIRSFHKLGSAHSDSDSDTLEKKVLDKENRRQKLLRRRKDSTSSEDSSNTSGSSSPVSKKARHEFYKTNKASSLIKEKHPLKSDIYKVGSTNSENIKQLSNKRSYSPDLSSIIFRDNLRSPVTKDKEERNFKKHSNHSESRSRSSSASKSCVTKNNGKFESSSLPKICSESKSYSSKDHALKNTSSYKNSQPHDYDQSKSKKEASRSRSKTPGNYTGKIACESFGQPEHQKYRSHANESKLYNTTKTYSPSHKEDHRKNSDRKSNTDHSLAKYQKNCSPDRKEKEISKHLHSQLNRSSSESSSLSYSPIQKHPERYRDILENNSPDNKKSKSKYSSKSRSKHHKPLPSVMPRVRLRSSSEEDENNDNTEEDINKKNFESNREKDSEEEIETLKLLKSGLAVKAKESLGKKMHRAHSNPNQNISITLNCMSGLLTNSVTDDYKNKSVEECTESDTNSICRIELPSNGVSDDLPTVENNICKNISSDSCEPILTKHSTASSKSKSSTSPRSHKQVTTASNELQCFTSTVSKTLNSPTITQMPTTVGISKSASTVIPSSSTTCKAELAPDTQSTCKSSAPAIQQSLPLTVSKSLTPPQEFESSDISEENKLPVMTVEMLTVPDTESLVPESIPKPPGSPPNQISGNIADVQLRGPNSKRRRSLKRSRSPRQKKEKKVGRNTDSSSSSRSRSRDCEETSPKSHKSRSSSRSSHSQPSSRHASSSSSSSSRSKSPSESRSRSPTRSHTRSPTRSLTHSRSRSHSSNSSRSSHSASHSSHSSSDSSRSRSPSIPRRKGSPSFLDRRRITSARKRPIPYHRPTPPTPSTISSERSWSTTSSLSRRSWTDRSRSPTHSTSRSPSPYSR